MPITFTCPNPQCKSAMTVPDNLAGKRGNCSKCKGPVTVPAPQKNGTSAPVAQATRPAPPTPREVPAEPPPVDFEAEALAALSDAPTEAEKASDFIEFICPQCDEPLKMALDLAGKRAPCPECRRIIPVPYPEKKDKLGWRDTGPKLPTGAKRDIGPALEGAWGTDGRTLVSNEALKDAGVIKEKEKPLTFGQKSRPYVLFGTPVVLLGAGALVVWAWMARTTEKNSLNYALKAAGDPAMSKAIGNDGLLALHGYAGQYFLRSPKQEARDSAREQFGKAVALARTTRSPASDALLADLALAQLALGGSAEDTPADRKRHWAETQKLVTAALREIDSSEGRVAALRRLTPALVEAGQIERLQPILSALYSSVDADRSEALATVGLELEHLGRKDDAQRLLTDALTPYAVEDKKKKDRPQLRPAVVALAKLLGKPAPPPAEKDMGEVRRQRIGEADALARQGKLAEARELDKHDAFSVAGAKVRFLVAVAVAAAESKNGTEDIQTAIEAAKAGSRDENGWEVLRLIEAGLQAGLSPDALEPAAAGMGDPAMQAWAKLVLLRARLAASRSVEPAELAEAIPANTLGGLAARLELARHNTRLSSGWASKIKTWDEGPRALGSLGVALGMQKGR